MMRSAFFFVAPARKFIFLALLLCTWTVVQAQGSADRELLRKEIEHAKTLSENGQEIEAEKVYISIDSMARAMQDSVGIIVANIGLINNHIDEAEYVDSLLDMIHTFFTPNMKHGYLVEYHIDKAHVSNLKGDYVKQISHIDSALTISHAANDSLNIAFAYFELSNAYSNVENYTSALKTARSAEAYFAGLGYDYYKAYAVRSIALTLSSLGQYEASIKELERSNDLFASSNFAIYQAYNNGLIGKNYLDMGEYEKAEGFLVRSKKDTENLFDKGFNGGYPQILCWLGELYRRTGKRAKAVKAFNLAYAVSDSMKVEDDKHNALEGLVRVALSETQDGPNYLDEYLASIKNQYETDKSRAVVEFEKKYKAQESERRILELDKLAKEAEIRAQNDRLLVIVVLSVCTLLILLGLILILRARYRTRMRFNELKRKALQLQINPHFFFNVLNSINQYIAENDQKSARYYLVKFAKLMRLSLENSQFDLVPFGQEADLVEAYLHLEKLRKDNFDFEIKVSQGLRDLRIPPLMIQPFVENAIVHAFPHHMPGKGHILLEARAEDEGYLDLVISDNGIGIQPKSEPDPEVEEGKTSLAIGILEKRLNAYGKRKGGIRYATAYPEKKNFPGTQVFIRIPLSS